jgi:alkyl hydroperoxide reductase subunit AhpC
MFRAQAITGSDRGEVSLADFRGQHVVLMFFPLDVTLLCAAELLDFRSRLAEFAGRGAHVLAIAVDNELIQLVYQRLAPPDAAAEERYFTIVSDPDRAISAAYGVLLPAGVALRGLFIIDREGIIRHVTMNDRSVPRNVDECLRVLDALLEAEEKGLILPVDEGPPAAGSDKSEAPPARRRLVRRLFPPNSDPGWRN